MTPDKIKEAHRLLEKINKLENALEQFNNEARIEFIRGKTTPTSGTVSSHSLYYLGREVGDEAIEELKTETLPDAVDKWFKQQIDELRDKLAKLGVSVNG